MLTAHSSTTTAARHRPAASDAPALPLAAIRSGGQTGADRAALDWALARGVPHGGWVPRGRGAEDGPIDAKYGGLVETPSARVEQRTEWNVRDADYTALFTMTGPTATSDNHFKTLKGGTKHTADCAWGLSKPYKHFHADAWPPAAAAAHLRKKMADRGASTLNVAGPRASEEPGVYAYVQAVLSAAFDAERRRLHAPTRPRLDSQSPGEASSPCATPARAAADVAPVSAVPTSQDAQIRLCVAAIPPLPRRPKEPRPEELFAAHNVPACRRSHLRVCTWNLLNDARVAKGMGGMHAKWDLRRVNVLRNMLAIDADVYLLQELHHNSHFFLRAVLPDYTLLTGGGQGVMFRNTPRKVGKERRVYCSLVSDKKADGLGLRLIKSTTHRNVTLAPVYRALLEVHGLGGDGAAPFRLLAGAMHCAGFKPSGPSGPSGQMVDNNTEARNITTQVGRDLWRLPARHKAPMVIGGDFNAAKRDGSGALYRAFTCAEERAAGSEDELSEDEDEEREWPPPGRAALATDLWAHDTVTQKEYGGLQRGSTCLSALGQGKTGQGLIARAAEHAARGEPWPEDRPCTDDGHIDWLLSAAAGAEHGKVQLRARRAVVATERVLPPLRPNDATELHGDADALPVDGAIFASDHYAVFTDVEFKYVFTDEEDAALAALQSATLAAEPDLAEVARAVAAAEAYADHPDIAEAIGIARKGLARATQ